MPPDGNVGDPLFSPAARQAALESFWNLLQGTSSPLAANFEATDQLMRQANAVLDDVEAALAGADDTTEQRAAVLLAAEIGVSRADQRVHPAESLRAAATMFEALLPAVRTAVRDRQADERAMSLATVTLHKSILHRLELGARAYAGYLLKKVNGWHRQERHRIARELHDQAAHAVGVALQDLELHDVYVGRDPERAEFRLGTARAALREALDVVRHLAMELKESPVEVGGLERALSSYLIWRVPAEIRTSLSVASAADLPSKVVEELYFMLREAIRNTVLHAQARNVTVTLTVADGETHATVHDDGQGFEVNAANLNAGIGLSSIRERLELLDGTLDIVSSPGQGTTISIRIAHEREHNRGRTALS